MRYIYILLLSLALQTQIYSAELVKVYSQVGVEEYRLDNGMKVLIKNNQLDEDEVFVRITSWGGYAQEPMLKDKISAFLSFTALLESGLGRDASLDQVSKMLYEHSAELSLFVLPSSKGIEAKIPAHHFDAFIEYICGVFKDHKISKKGYDSVLASLSKEVEDLSVKTKYNVIGKLYNIYFDGNHFSGDSPGDAIKLADLNAAQEFVDRAFSDNDPFTIIVVGDVNSKKVIETLDSHLPKKRYEYKKMMIADHAVQVNEPKMITMKGLNGKEPVNSVTYTLKIDPAGKEFAIFEMSLKVIENRLQEKLSALVGRKGFRVSFDFPYYPDVTFSWVQIKCNVADPLKQPILSAINHHLTDLISNGPSHAELQAVKSSLMREGMLLKNDNYFWLTSIADYSLSGWDLNQVLLRVDQDPSITPDQIKEFLKKSLGLHAPVVIFTD